MALEIKHNFISDKLDGGDPDLLQPSYWNDIHKITVPGSALVGNAQASEGDAESISVLPGSGLKLDAASKTLELESQGLATAEIVVAETPTEDMPEHRVTTASPTITWDRATANQIKANLADEGVQYAHLATQTRGGALVYGAGGVPQYLAPTKLGEVLHSGDAATTAQWGGTGAPHAVLQGRRSAGVSDGAHAAGSWIGRFLNTQVYDYMNVVNALTNNAFQLLEGTYVVEWGTPGYKVGSFQSRLQNLTDDTTVAPGTSTFSFNGAEGSLVYSTGIVKFALTASKNLIIQSRASVANATNGCGIAADFGLQELFTWVKVWKIVAP